MITILELNKIHQGDCLELMKDVPDGSIDMILCDLPYGQTSNKWDSVLDLDLLWTQYNRIIKENGCIALTAKGRFMVDLINSNRDMYRYEWVWNKNKGSNFAHAKRMPLNVHEYVLIFYKRQPTYNPQMTQGKAYFQKRANDKAVGIADNIERKSSGSKDGLRYPKTIIEVEGMAQRHIIHKTQKPVSLYEYLIKTYTDEGDLVLDNCAGSGTIGVASINTNRNWIGIELEEDFVDMSNKRIDEHISKIDAV